jgi:hypothetical protein
MASDGTPKPYSVSAEGTVPLDGPIYGLRVTAPQPSAYVKINDGIVIPLESLSHYDARRDQAWQRITLFNPNANAGTLKVEVQYGADVPFSSPVGQPIALNSSGQVLTQLRGNVLRGGSNFGGIHDLACDDWGNLRVRDAESEELIVVSSDWVITDGTHYLTEDGASDSAQVVPLEPWYTGVRLEIFNGVLSGGASPSVQFYIDEVDDAGNLLKAHAAGQANDFGPPAAGYIHLQRGCEEAASDDLTRRVGVRPRNVQFRYLTTNVTAFAGSTRVILFR